MKAKKWDIQDKSFELAYCSHAIEHLSDEAVKNLFSNVFRILKKGSTFRIVVPNIDLALYHYENKNLEWFQICYGKFAHLPKDINFALEHYLLTFFATKKREEVNLREVRENFRKLSKQKFIEKYGSDYTYSNPNYHINWWNFEKLKKFLEKERFMDVKKSCFRQSEIPEFCNNDFDGTIPQMSLFVDCKK
jgi:SAM-dependent methyltransferase